MQEYEGNKQGNIGHNWVYLVEIGLRATTIATLVAASCLTFSCKQVALVFGVPMDAKYSYSSAFKFFAFATAIASGFALLSLILTVTLRWKGELKANFHYLFFLHDLVMAILLVGASAGATAIGYVGKYGNEYAGWVPICDNFRAFCHKATVAIILGYLAFFSFLSVTLINATNSRHQLSIKAQVQDI